MDKMGLRKKRKLKLRERLRSKFFQGKIEAKKSSLHKPPASQSGKPSTLDR